MNLIAMADDDVVRGAVGELNSEQRGKLAPVLKDLLDAQGTRIEYAESRRSSLGVLGGVILAAGLAALIQIARGQFEYFPAFLALLSGAISLTLTGVIVLALYARQTNWDYPFKKLSGPWKWFYRDAIPGAEDVEPKLHTGQSESFKKRSREIFLRDRKSYAKKVVTLADDKLNLEQDLGQVYLLHWNEFYKNRFLSHLRSTLIRGVVTSVVIAGVAFAVGVIWFADQYESDDPPPTPPIVAENKR